MRIPRPRLAVAALLVVAAVVWARVNRPFEGPTLIEVTHNHGFTVADLLSVGLVLLAVIVAWPVRGDARSDRRRPPDPR